MGCEGTLATWDLATVLGRTSQDIPGYSEAVHHIFVYLGQLGKSVAVLDIYADGIFRRFFRLVTRLLMYKPTQHSF